MIDTFKRISALSFVAVLGMVDPVLGVQTPIDILEPKPILITQNASNLRASFPHLPVVDTEDFYIVGGRNPFSEVVILWDSFTGEERLVVFDKDYRTGYVRNNQAELGQFSAWGADRVYIAEYAIVSGRDDVVAPASAVMLRIDEHLFALEPIEGSNGTFALSSDVIDAIASAQTEIQVRTQSIRNSVSTFTIGTRTVRAYQQLISLLDN